MEAFRNENVKFKAFVKERLYGVEVTTTIFDNHFRGVSTTRN
jgi:hypothetical protein